MSSQIEISPSRMIRPLAGIMIFFIVASTALMLSRQFLGHGRLLGLGTMIDLWSENNLPTMYQSMTLLLCGFLLNLISSNERQTGGKFRWHWLGMAVVFMFLSIDEMLQFHDRLSEPLRALGASGAFYFGWVIPYGIALVVLGLVYLRFFLKLRPHTRVMMIWAAVYYIGGALGMEMLESLEFESVQNRSLLLDAYVIIEESLEMLGVLIFIYALIEELSRRQVQLHFLGGLAHQTMAVAETKGPREDVSWTGAPEVIRRTLPRS